LLTVPTGSVPTKAVIASGSADPPTSTDSYGAPETSTDRTSA
jgi:hypothetical protein